MTDNAVEEILIIKNDLKNILKNNNKHRPDQLARSLVIMATQIIIIMFLSDDALSVFTDNQSKNKKYYAIDLKLLRDNVVSKATHGPYHFHWWLYLPHYHVVILNLSHNIFIL